MSARGRISDRSQEGAILAYLRGGAELSPLEALQRFGCLRLGARVYELRRAGHPIEARMVRLGNGKVVAQYRMAQR